ncbi:BamA/TamA family outer membrane protein [Taibaiella koreensis]|uniref:BamA/TamA family outer membrane protein n=1 Tax=Taibaiella koreensis TaxID=1268548 RepID=UPI000E59E8BB|nr:BamA/TamA family outer membrane protein [Taibaiella koreensis]
MKQCFTVLFLFFCNVTALQAQDSVRSRVILIGDAGEMDDQQKLVIPHAAAQVLPGKTTVLYLGDNIYPHGMGLPGSPEEKLTQEILKSQYQPMREQGAPVYFVPGNHDWDRMGPQGLAKIKQQWQYLQSQGDSLLQLVPPDGCPDPVAIPISDSLVVIALDSEWWLYPFDKENKDADCDCRSTTDVVNALQELFYQNRYKTILLATHHPFQSYGTHGGYFSWKDHIFPLTVVSKNLYVPLPGIGSIYPLFRKYFTNPEDVRHPLYQYMIKSVDNVFRDFPNLIHVSGHEHGLQLIDNKKDNQFQIVSGGGAKENYTIKGKHSLFGTATQGYVLADQLYNNDVRFTFYTYQDGKVTEAFRFTRPYKPFKPKEGAAFKSITGDSTVAQAHAAYANDGKLYQLVFGKNYRKEWTQPAMLPVLRVSEIAGGLKPVKLGGGFQSTSLRLQDANGKEYALRTVEKKPDLVVPVPFQGTFVRELLDDATSAQHPYSALIVAPVAKALDVPHSVPVIGVAAPDSSLGMYRKLFEGKVSLLEEREPLGKSENYIKMLKDLQKDNDNSYDAYNFLKARMIDVLFADWDRHGDQWRFFNKNGKDEDKYFVAIPRDRDMVLNITQGILPTAIKRLFVMPRVYGFKGNVKTGANHYLYKSAFLNAHPASQMSHDEWLRAEQEFKTQVTDAVLEEGLQQLPKDIYPLRHDWLLSALKQRRDGMAEAMEGYYRFSNNIVDIHTSNKNEFVLAEDVPGKNATHLLIRKINKSGELKDTLLDKVYPRSLTRELRLYIGKGDDSLVVNTPHSGVKLRVIGGKGDKAYNIIDSRKRIKLYDREEERYYGRTGKLAKHLRDDSLNTAFTPVNLYHTSLPLITAAINPDDGLSLGLGMRLTRQKGFRQLPYAALHQFMLSHSFSTEAFHIRYNGEFIKAIGNADVVIDANIKAPDNTQNFFGRGNETEFDKTGNFKRYYRTRFNLIDISTALRWRGEKGSALSIGPSVEYYHLNDHENDGRFIEQTSKLNSYDSAIVEKDKTHLGLIIAYTLDQRNDKILPRWGTYVNIELQGYTGLNSYSRSFMRIVPEIALYKSLNARQTIVLADRFGGGISIGNPAFYQSMFLGGQGNLLGYRQYRFAGQHSLYNNLELRISLADFGNYIFKGQFGIAGFYDIGRVWVSGEQSDKWHNGVGAGLFLSPANLAVFRVNMAYSEEGWYPNFAMGFRF